MGPSENKELMRRIFSETARGNGRPFIESLADDVCWTIMGTTGWSKTYRGKSAVLAELLGPLSAQLAGQNTIVAHRFIAEDDFVVVEGRGRNLTKAGQPYENTYCWVCRLADGKLTELTEYADTQLIATVLNDPA